MTLRANSLACIRLALVLVIAGKGLSTGGCSGLRNVRQPAVLVDEVPEIPELRAAHEGSRLERVRGADGVEIPVRVFGESGDRTPVVMTHGLESHSGWFVQSARFLAQTGRPVYSFDRRGSGLSTAPRGDCDDYSQMVSDVASIVEHASARHGVSRVHILGHCFGAVPATLYACRNPATVRSLIVATPGLRTRADLTLGQKLRVVWSQMTGDEAVLPVPLELEFFTGLERFRDFIATDPLALREATTSFYWEVMQARDALDDEREHLRMPIFLAMARKDRICDNDGNLSYVSSLPSSRKLVVEYREAIHILEFSLERDEFFADLADWLALSARGG